MTVINEFQQLNLFVFKLLFYVISDMSIKPIVKFMISLTLLLKKYQLFKKYYIFIKFWAFYEGRWVIFLIENFLFCCGALGLGFGLDL